jgi:hypothetical protein
MPLMRMNSLKSRAMNCGPLSLMIRGVGENVWFEAPDERGHETGGASVEVASPEEAGECADPGEGDAGPAGDHHQEKSAFAVGFDEVFAHTEDGHRAGAFVKAGPIFLVAGRHHGQGGDHPHGRRVVAIEIVAADFPVAESGDEMSWLVERGAMHVGAVGE